MESPEAIARESVDDTEARTASRVAFDWAPAAVAAIFSTFGFLWLDEHGVALSRDSTHYLGVAVDLHFDGFSLPGEPAYPVGYPLLVAQVMRLEPFAADAARWLSWISYVVLLSCGVASFRRVAGPVVSALAVALLATMPAIVVQHDYALAGAPFGALIQLHVLLTVMHARARGRARWGWLVAAALVLGVATVVRVIGYAAITVFSAFVLWQVILARHRLREVGALLAAHSFCYLPALSIAIGYSVIGRPVHGYRGGSHEPLGLNVERAIAALGNDLGAVLLVPVALAAAWLVWRVARESVEDERATATFSVAYSLVQCGVYLTAIVVAATVTKVSPVGSRFFAPYYGVALIAVIGAVGLAPARLRGLASVLLSLILGASVVSNRAAIAAAHTSRAEAAQGAPLHFQHGFAASPNTRPLREFLGRLAGSDDVSSLSILSPLPRRGHHVEGARSLLFVRSAVASPVEAIRFRRLGPASWRVQLGAAREQGGLVYLGLDLDSEAEITPESTLAAALRAMVAGRRGSHWLLVPAHVDPLRRVGAIEGAPLRIEERRELGAYRAYRLGIAR